jgi:beta-lactamase regulating signal transducer with metallopeptidase domain
VHVLVNWLAQGVVIAAAAAAALRLVPASRTRARYCLVCVATMLVAAIPVLPMATATVTAKPAITEHLAHSMPAATLPMFTMPDAWWTSATVALALWLTWAVVYAARIGVGALAIRRVKRNGDDCPADVLARLEYWSRLQKTGRTARVMLSSEVRAAAVLGWGSPVIALSPALVRELSEDDLDRVLAHEWAHVQRFDDIARGVQALVHVVAGWHPAVRWLQRRLEVEREVACDEMAVATTGSAKAYAACLTALAARPMALNHPLAALNAISASGLHQRVVRILAARGDGWARPRRGIAIAAGTVMIALTVAVANLQIVEAAGAAMRASVDVGAVAHTRTLPTPATSAEPAEFSRSGVAPVRTRSHDAFADGTSDGVPVVSDVTGQAQETTATVPDAPERAELVGRAIPAALSTAVHVPSLSASDRNDRHSRPPEAGAVSASDEASTPWVGAVSAGLAIGRGSQNAGIVTGRVFSRVGKRVAGSF